jgi:hypothetical protein
VSFEIRGVLSDDVVRLGGQRTCLEPATREPASIGPRRGR